MKLSIIVPVYNVERYVEKCILSCEKQDVPKNEYEIVVVNDGSPDNSLQIVKRLALENPNICVITRPNGGLSAARNTGLDNATGDYVFFVDSDDWIKENCLGLLFEKLKEEQPDVLCICAALGEGESYVRQMSYGQRESVDGPRSMGVVPFACAPFQIVRRSFLNDNSIRFYEGIYHEDNEYTPRLLYMAKKVSFLNDVLYFVTQNPDSITHTKNIKRVTDVIGVVVPSLDAFVKEHVLPSDRLVFHRIIASSINTVLLRNGPMNKKEKALVNQLCVQNKDIFSHLLLSRKAKYRIEGFLFSTFPSRTVEIYEILNFFLKKR